MHTALTHSDPDIRANAERKMLQWEEIQLAMAEGRLTVGSRAPVAGLPAWVTLNVAHGGFATGDSAAGGPLLDWERELLSLTTDPDTASPRLALNRWFTSDEGISTLQDALDSRQYRIQVPEEAALLAVAWQLKTGHGGAALDLLQSIWPHFHTLRFYPNLTSGLAKTGAIINLETVGQLVERLNRVEPSAQVATMNTSLTVWNPLFDELVDLWLETMVDGEPGAIVPDGWSQRRGAWVGAFLYARDRHELPARYAKVRSNFEILSDALVNSFGANFGANAPRIRGLVRTRIKAVIAKRGAPGSEAHEALRHEQEIQAGLPTIDALAQAVIERLADEDREAGINDLDATIAPVVVADWSEALDVPPFLVRKIERALEAPLEELIERRIVRSSETLASLLPQISSQVAASSFSDTEIRDVYRELYRAFRSRRSLLLLNYEHQVQIEELPWVDALADHRTSDPTVARTAFETLASTALLAFVSFPQTILPNKLVREFDALGKQANLDLALTEEIASDIFMGSFTTKWARASAVASNSLRGSLYERYYDLPAVTELVDPGKYRPSKSKPPQPQSAEQFAQLCVDRSREAHLGDGGFVARNGAIIEQSQILTTHNLAPLVEGLGLRPLLEPQAGHLADRCFEWLVRASAIETTNWRAQMQTTKNAAFALRQAIYFLSLCPDDEMRSVVDGFRAHTAVERNSAWRRRFEPVITGVEAVAAGNHFDAGGRLGEGRRLLGWTVGRHWLLP